MGAIPARLHRTKRLATLLGLDRNPLRRGTDRVLGWIRVGMVAVFLTGGPLAAIGAGQWMYHAARIEARTQAADRHTVQAVLLEPTPPPVFTMAATRWGGEAWVQARWTAAGAALRTGDVLAPTGLPAGSQVTAWLDASGNPTRPPLLPSQVIDRTVAAAAVAPAVLALVLLTALWIAHRIGDRRRLAGWDEAWMTIGPEWTGRRP